MRAGERDEAVLHAYHDGELGPFARLRFERRLARSPELRSQLESLAALGEIAVEHDAATPTPDLWDRIAQRLPAIDARREEERARAQGRGLAPLFKPLGAAAGVAVLALAVGLGLLREGAGVPGVVRWIDTGGRGVIVLDDREAVTIIWVVDAPVEGA